MGKGVTDVGILQLVHAIFSLYILHFTFYTLLGTPRSRLPYALKWAGEGQGNCHGGSCVSILQLVRATLSMVIRQGFAERFRFIRLAQHQRFEMGWRQTGKRRGTEGKAWRERLGTHLGKVGFRLIGSVA